MEDEDESDEELYDLEMLDNFSIPAETLKPLAKVWADYETAFE